MVAQILAGEREFARETFPPPNIYFGEIPIFALLIVLIFMSRHRTLVCTSVTLIAGISSAYIGGQLSAHFHGEKCQRQGWGWQQLCSLTSTPTAIWQGSTTGLWTGITLGAFFGGIVSRERSE